LVAGLRAASNELCVVVPVDCPSLTPASLLELANACEDAAFPPTGPLPGAYRRSALPALEAALEAEQLVLRAAVAGLRTRVVDLDPRELVNVNTRADLSHVDPPRG
jgi:molybdopterin-guanine dinucleotide biosynthesis protein A